MRPARCLWSSEACPLRSRALDAALNAAAVFGISLVLLAAYGFQFALGEQPCPLCTLQRVAFVLAMFGFLLNVRFGAQPLHYAIVLLSVAFGMTVSGRQVLLHVTPGTPHYGGALFGLHFYTWAFIVFAAMIPGTALLLAVHRGSKTQPVGAGSVPGWLRAVCWLGVAVTVAMRSPSSCNAVPSNAPTTRSAGGFRGTNR